VNDGLFRAGGLKLDDAVPGRFDLIDFRSVTFEKTFAVLLSEYIFIPAFCALRFR